jgi:8-oxo-dGTP diphosphatase
VGGVRPARRALTVRPRRYRARVQRQGTARHLATPRTLVLLRRGRKRLFLEGGPKKWFAGLRNGVGGSVEAGEDVFAAARREVIEETGLAPASLDLAAVVHVMAEPVVMLFVFTGTLEDGDVRASDEGALVWLDDAELASPSARLVPDLVDLLPRLAARRAGDAPLSLVSRP